MNTQISPVHLFTLFVPALNSKQEILKLRRLKMLKILNIFNYILFNSKSLLNKSI